MDRLSTVAPPFTSFENLRTGFDFPQGRTDEGHPAIVPFVLGTSPAWRGSTDTARPQRPRQRLEQRFRLVVRVLAG